MNTKQIIGFCELAKHNNFSKAAQAIYMTQPAFSRMIQSLEEEVGHALFDRNKAHPKLTPMGEKLLPEMQGIRQHIEKMQRIAVSGNRAMEGTVVIASFRFGWAEKAQTLCTEFLKENPSIRIDVLEQSGVSVFEALKTGEVDLVQTMYVPESIRPYLGSLEAELYHYVVLLSPNHPLTAKKELTMAELKDEKFAIFSKESFPLMYERLLAACTQAGYVPNIVYETDSRSMLLNHVAAGSSIAVIPNFFTIYSGVEVRPFLDSVPEPCCWFWWRNNNKPQVKAFLDFVKMHQ